MKLLVLLTCLSVASARAQQPSATTIRVGLFTTQTVHKLTITPLGKSSWMQTCAACPRTALQAPLNLDHVQHTLSLGGNFRIQPEGEVAPVEAAGLYAIEPASIGLRVTLQISSERYVAAVLSAEAAPDEPAASLEALAIAARTFALTNLHRHAVDGFDLCDSTHCQALRLGAVRPAVAEAVRNTAGISLWSGKQRASIYYTQHCAGISEAAATLWPAERAPYLTTHADAYCLRRGPAAWQANISFADLIRIATEQNWNLPAPITGIRIAQHTASGRAKLLDISSPSRTVTISASSLHFAINRALGWNRIRSDLYSVVIVGDAIQFNGHGYGHGVGLCQTGAFEMAVEHRTATEILNFYFPNTHIGLTASGGVWHEESIGAVTLRSVTADAGFDQSVQIAWQRALALFPPASEIPHAAVVLAPTTELFRQLTSSPGYLLAVTRGDQITLQPTSVLRRYGAIEPLLLHEFLHTRIESQSTDKAPLWLREGLAEALAEIDSAYVAPKSSIESIEQRLADPQSLAESQEAHRDAAALVRMLGHTYSLTVMRQWLRDGVPAQVVTQMTGSHETANRQQSPRVQSTPTAHPR
jgi:stage II sporulation protein D